MRSLSRHTRVLVTSFVLAAVLVASAVPALAGVDRHQAPAEVRISRDVRLGQFSEAGITLWARCRAPFVVQDLVVEVSQAGGSVFGSVAGDFGLQCDDAWHRIETSVSTPGGGPFAPGRTTVTATLTVIDPVTGDPAGQGRDSITVWVFGQAEVKVSRDVRLGQGDAMLVRVFARCEEPWVEPDLTVEVTQAEGTRAGSTAGDFGIVCDDRWRRIDLQVFSSGEPFERGRTTVTASLSVLDPIDFDPVDSDTDSVTVWVHAAADVLIRRRAEISAGGTLQLPVLVRCQRPWVVQDLAVDVTQTQNGGSNAGDFGIVCDGQWHRVVVPIDPVVGPWFPGPADVNAFFTVLDPDSFDPVDQAQGSRTIQLVGAPPPVLYDQTGDQVGAIISSDQPDDGVLDAQGADDFVVPAGQQWTILLVEAPGSSGIVPEVPAVNVSFYDDAGGEPGNLVLSLVGRVPLEAPDDLSIPLGLTATLGAGTYWISVQADVTTLGPSASWLWSFRGTVTGDTGVWRTLPEDAPAVWGAFNDFEFLLRGTTTPV